MMRKSMKTIYEKQEPIPVVDNYDIIVCGGGPAGFIAAISAAREGMRTALIERYSFLGGTATAGLVVPISGFFHNGEQVVGGIAWEFVQKLIAMDAAKIECPKGHISFHPETYKLVAQRMILESGVALYTNSYLIGCSVEEETLTHLIIETPNGREAVSAKCFIDATGSAALCRLAKVPMMPDAESLQPLSLCFLLGGVDTSTPLLADCIHHDGKCGKPSCNTEIQQYLQECVDAGLIDQFGGPWFNTILQGDALAVNMTRRAGNPLDRKSLLQAELTLREDMYRLVELLKARYIEFRNCTIVSSAVNAGIRESQRILGITTVSGADLLNGKKPVCPVARCAHPMDIHHADSTRQTLTELPGKAYVPHTALIPRGITNLVASGRCISADRDAYASIRVQGTLMSIGESAGILAAMCAITNLPISELDSDEINTSLSTHILL